MFLCVTSNKEKALEIYILNLPPINPSLRRHFDLKFTGAANNITSDSQYVSEAASTTTGLWDWNT